MLNALTPEQRGELAEQSYMAYAERGELIWLEGGQPEFFAIVGIGFVKMTRSSAKGQEVAVEILGPGQCLGLLAALEKRPLPLSAIAVANTWYLKVPIPLFMRLYAASVAIRDQVLRTVTPRLRRAHDMMCRLCSGRVEERIAAVLFILADSYGTATEKGRRIDVPLTRQDLAEMAGTTVETTIRVLSRWRKDGVVSTEHQMLTLLDEDALVESVTG